MTQCHVNVTIHSYDGSLPVTNRCHMNLISRCSALATALMLAHAGTAAAIDLPKVSGYLQYDITRFDDSVPPLRDASQWRRVRLAFAGKLGAVDYKAEWDPIADAWTDAYFRFDAAGGKVYVGQFKQPFGLDALPSDRVATFIESTTSNAFASNRRLGLQYLRENADYTFALSGYSKDIKENGPDQGFGARYTRAIRHGDDLIHLGAAAAQESLANDRYSLSLRPDTSPNANNWLRSGTIAAHDLYKAGVELGWQHGPMLLTSEWMHSRIDGNGPTRDLSGGYVAGQWTLIGAPRAYEHGMFTGQATTPGKLSALDLVARYSQIDIPLNAGGGNGQRTLMLGVNALVGNHWRLQLDYVDGKTHDGRDASGVLARVQLSF